jgi:hypothetical protein
LNQPAVDGGANRWFTIFRNGNLASSSRATTIVEREDSESSSRTETSHHQAVARFGIGCDDVRIRTDGMAKAITSDHAAPFPAPSA